MDGESNQSAAGMSDMKRGKKKRHKKRKAEKRESGKEDNVVSKHLCVLFWQLVFFSCGNVSFGLNYIQY